MARDNTKARLQLELQLSLLALDGARPTGTFEWVSAAAPVVTQAAVGAGHWAAGRRQRALAAWAWAVGSALTTTGAEKTWRNLGHFDAWHTLARDTLAAVPKTATALNSS